tara:strand:+ start:584 stop:1147 length:564 start_codon:yes stop_codon:yes gene_type:complete
MSASSGLAAAKRRRGNNPSPQLEESNQVIDNNSEQLELPIEGVISVHEAKFKQLYNYHLDDKKKIENIDELYKNVLKKIEHMDGFIKELCDEHNEAVVQIEALEDKIKVLEEQKNAPVIKKGRKNSKDKKPDPPAETVVNDKEELEPTFPSITDENVLFSTNELNTNLENLGNVSDISDMSDLKLDD